MLNHMSDQELLKQLKEKVKMERALLIDLLKFLEEVERRELHLARGYSSLFAFCVGELNYSEGEAHIRIQAMRLTKAVPEVKSKITSGELSLTVAAKAQGCFGRAAKSDQLVPKDKKIEVINSLLNLSTRDAERKLVGSFPEAGLPKEFAKPLSEEMTRIEFNANKQQLEKFEKLKNLLAHKNFDGRWDRLFENLADIAMAKFEKQGKVVTNDAALLDAHQVKARQEDAKTRSRSSDPNIKRSRHIPTDVQRFVWERDQGKCQFKDPFTGKRCESQHAIQCDHIVPYSHGGENISTNLQLMCSRHNQFRARLL